MRVRTTADEDIATLMLWFTDAAAVRSWAGPNFRFPFDRAGFVEDLRLGKVPSWTATSDATEILGFGQCYERWGRMNLARLVIDPGKRGSGAGRLFVCELMRLASARLRLEEFSLFVYRDNAAAQGLYRSLGFVVSACPHPEPHLDGCDYMVRPADI